ncbi:hypothetical protein K7432_014876 [Basidiobolus ranarum]|uniref:Uncharacterized protein n=1 Tax=Basidiobolus ranarum TaxID=34480 RepID=A0ABR2WGW2_9FUNG
MDYFSRFKYKVVGPKNRPNQALQLTKFRECWRTIQNALEYPNVNPDVKVAKLFKTIVDLLVQEEIRTEEGTTGLCMEYLLKNNVLSKLVVLSGKNSPNGIRGEVIRLISSMINLLDDKFLVHNAAHAPTLKIINDCMDRREWRENYADDLVDLMYNICSKIHGYPELLHIFFHDKQWLTVPQKSNARRAKEPVTVSSPDLSKNSSPESVNLSHNGRREYEFGFFKHLMEFIHKEGKTGDIARTGLLFLMDITDSGLRDFILTGDFCAIIAAGLGAFYSQLPRKLVIEVSSEHASSNHNASRPEEIQVSETSNSPEFQMMLESFLKYLDFTQEVLVRCSSGSICNLLLENTKTLFLENILYPSLLECSDMDGSAVAVITYLDILVQSIKNNELNVMIVSYLVNSDPSKFPSCVSHTEISDTKAQHMSAANGSSHHMTIPPLLPYNMKDLIFSNLRSTSQPAVIASLKLLKTMLTRHCFYTLSFLDIEFIPPLEESIGEKSYTPVVDHLRVLSRYLSLISLIDPSHEKRISVRGYGDYLVDAETSMEYHERYHRDDMAHMRPKNPLVEGKKKRHARTMSIRYSNLEVTKNLSLEEKPMEVTSTPLQNLGKCGHCKHRIQSTDHMMHVLIGLLSGYFGQSCELNLAVTGVLIAVISCPCRDLEGWVSSKNEALTPSSSRNSRYSPTFSELKESEEYDTQPPGLIYDDESSDEEMDVYSQEGDYSRIRSFEDPTFFAVLEELSNQVVRYRRELFGFDQQFRMRREELLSLGGGSTRNALRISNEKEMNLNAKSKSFEEVVDNAIILSEVIKEVVSIVQVRRSFGVNEVWYI